jgi:hypothetical protein
MFFVKDKMVLVLVVLILVEALRTVFSIVFIDDDALLDAGSILYGKRRKLLQLKLMYVLVLMKTWILRVRQNND